MAALAGLRNAGAPVVVASRCSPRPQARARRARTVGGTALRAQQVIACSRTWGRQDKPAGPEALALESRYNSCRGPRPPACFAALIRLPRTWRLVIMDRRVFLQDAAATAVAIALPGRARKAEPDLTPVFAQIAKRHDEGVERLQQWIRQPSIAAEHRGMNEGCELTMRMLREAGFGQGTKLPTDGQPGIFATLDAGAPRTLGLYFMYDVKQADPAEWTSPPWEAALVDRPGLGKVLVGRGAVNQKGPEAAFLAALHAIRGAGRKPPVNFVLVAEGEEEIGSPHFPQIVRQPEGLAALRRSGGILLPAG